MKKMLELPWWRIGSVLLAVATILAIVIALWPAQQVASAPGWTAPADISHASWGVYSPEMVLDSQGYTHAVWWGNGQNGLDWWIFYANNRTGTWSTPVHISPQGDIRNAKIAITANDQLHVVYEDRGAEDIMYTYSTDYGATWSGRTNISQTSGKAYECSIGIDADGNIYAVWIDSRWAGSPLYETTFSKKVGTTWTSPTRVQSQIRFNKAPKIIATGSGTSLKLHIVFYGKSSDTAPNSEYEAYYVRGDGSTWEAPLNISSSAGLSSYDPDLAAGAANALFYVWDEEPQGSYHDIYMKRSTDNGSTWSTATQITYDPNLSRYPADAYGQLKVHIGYDSNSAGAGDVFYAVYDPASGQLASPVNLSSSSGESKEVDLVVNDCRVAAAYMDKLSSWTILYTTTPTTAPGPCGIPTPTPTSAYTPTPTPTPTNTPTPTPVDPRPHGYVNIEAQDPPEDMGYTRLYTTTLHLSATSAYNYPITEVRFDNFDDFHAHPNWETFVPTFANWSLYPTVYDCEYKWVFAQFRDNQGNTSTTVADYIFYDNYLTAAMTLNGGNAYTNRTMVMVNTDDLDSDALCSGLASMRLWEEGGVPTNWLDFDPNVYFFLMPEGAAPITRTVYVEYKDHAGNQGVYSDTILLDTIPPFTGTMPTLNDGISLTGRLLITVSGLMAEDGESGIAHIWLANRADGPWMSFPYCAQPPCTILHWNLGFGGPPIQLPGIHTVYIKYEDGSGYGLFPGNFSEVYTGTIRVHDITNVFAPLIQKHAYSNGTLQQGDKSDQVQLIMVAGPVQANTGEVTLYLAARREQVDPLTGMLRMTLPEGLRVVNAWSAYGEILSTGDREVVSRETTFSRQAPWIIVRAKIENNNVDTLQVRGDMTWDNGSTTAQPLLLNAR